MPSAHSVFRVLPKSLAACALLAGLSSPPLAAAQASGTWAPNAPVHLVVPYPPGGGTDVAARLLAAGLGDKLGQPLIVENRPGANGVVAANLVYGAKPDGLTLFFAVSDVISTAPHVNPDVIHFKPDGFRAVAPVGRGGYVLVAPAEKAKATFAEMLQHMKAPDAHLNYGHWGAGSMSQMAMEQFKLAVGVPNLKAIPYKGSAPVMNAVAGAQVDYAFIPPNLAVAAKSRLKMYAVSSAERIPLLPDLPTLKELGLDVNAETLYGVVAPPGTPAAVVDALHDRMAAVTRDPAFAARLVDLGYASVSMSPAEMDAYLKTDYARWGDVVKRADIKAE